MRLFSKFVFKYNFSKANNDFVSYVPEESNNYFGDTNILKEKKRPMAKKIKKNKSEN